ncbi:MAG: ATP-binding protein [Desulfobacteraceae bacterium]|jgi:nitrogen fixation/metabolism regulation signal transduction histidine kinase
MLTRSFKFKITFRILLLTATIILLAYLVFKMNFIFVTVTVAILAVCQVFSLIYFAEKTNRDLSRFLLSIRYDDTSQAFASEGLGTSFSELKKAFSAVMRKLQHSRSEKEVHSRYLNTIIQHVGIGLIVYRPDGTINLINNAAKKIFKVSVLKNINEIKTKYPNLVDTLLNLKQNEKKLIKLQREDETGNFSIFSHPFVLKEEKNILVSIQNIQEELEEKELEAWQNLIRVLTHEIMNSITPISSMSSSLLDILVSDKKEGADSNSDITQDDMDDIVGALQTIHQRSQGLMNFVGNYRNMTLIPEPKFQIISLSDFFQSLERLMNDKLSDNGITLDWSVEPHSLELSADPDLMEQVMINLLLNAIQAVTGKNNPHIDLRAFLGPEGKTVITVEDNGVGIVEEALEKIFIPFFTTKEKGSGIGLSLSRRIIRLHRGTIKVKSIVDQGSTFTLTFV